MGDMSCHFKQDDIEWNQFCHRLIDINESSVPEASHQHYIETILNKTTLIEGLLYLFIPYIDLFFQGTTQKNKAL